MPYTAKIAGATVNVIQGTLNVTNEIGQRSTGSLHVWGALGTVYQYGTAVQVYDDQGALVYNGFTTKDKASRGPGARQNVGVLEHDLTLMDNAYKADKRRVFKSYALQSAGYIFTDLINSYLAAEGVTFTAASVATGPTIVEVIWDGTKSVSEAFSWLAQEAGYWWQIDVNNVAWFQPYGGTPAPFAIDGTQVDALQEVTVEYGNDRYVNKQYTKGGYAEKGSKASPLDETFQGDGSKRSFVLSYPVSVVYQMLVDGVDVTAQALVKGSNGGQWYYARGDAVVTQDPSQATLGAGHTLEVKYTGRYPVIASASNPALVTAQQTREGGGTGLVESVYVNTKVHTLAAGFQIASAMLSHYGQDTTTLTFSTRTKGLMPGQMLTVNLPDFALNNKQMLISAVAIDDMGADGFSVWFRVTAVGSPVESAQWQTFWQGLMNQSSDPSDFIDTQDAGLALLLSSTVSTTWTGTVTQTTHACPICSNATLCRATLTVIC